MNKRVCVLVMASIMMLVVVACGNKEEAKSTNSVAVSQNETATSNSSSNSPASTSVEARTITYLGEEYTVPAITERIIFAGSQESMEDALVLGVKPIGATTVGGDFPSMFADITDGVEGIGEKTQPNVETMLNLKPDIILGSTKFPAESIEKFKKVATTIPVSHISTDWEANLNLLAELTGRQEEAKQVLLKYKDDVKLFKEKIGTTFKDKNVLFVRVRAGNIAIYPEDVFFNPSIYAELGAIVPEEVKLAKAQQIVSLEKLSEINPDYLFVQFAEDENADNPKALEDLQSNPIWQSINAVKNNNLYINLVDPIAQGGTAYSKIAFLKAVGNIEFIQEK
ncbi:ABC transporter substrate-binding protein [Paenibacillus sp. FA6]|uniref:ABC transporter substrate-binding protein n=1 Tax=Paenibacillus sp. FA6 TaxID=3413029 RepID=UPI003F65DCF1